MAIETVGIPLAYVIVAALVLWMAITARGPWWVKALVTLLAVLFSLGLWRSLEGLQGWPVETGMPDRFEVKWTLAEEPNKKTGDPGAIYLWALDLAPPGGRGRPFALRLHTRDMGKEPRIFKLPYSRRLHEQTGEIQQEISAGGRFFGYLGAAGPGEGAPGGRGGPGREGAAGPPGTGGEGRERAGGTAPTRQDYIFHELPPPRLPEKSAPP
jgi:hypothetical protein